MPAVRLVPEVAFADLQLTVAKDGRLLFLPAPLGEFCLRNGLDPERVLPDEDAPCDIIARWYLAHREAGGERDPTVEHILEQIEVARDG